MHLEQTHGSESFPRALYYMDRVGAPRCDATSSYRGAARRDGSLFFMDPSSAPVAVFIPERPRL
jgi:hypothetical protein